MDRIHTHLCKGYGYLEYEKPEDAEKALKHMNGGQIDGMEICCELTLPYKGGSGDRRSPPRDYHRDRYDRERRNSPSRRRPRSPAAPRATGSNTIPLGNGRRHSSRSRSPRR